MTWLQDGREAPPIAVADLIAGMAKGMAVLESFDTERQKLNATLAAQRAGITRAAARRHLLTLAHLGYLESDGSYFWLSSKILRFSGTYLSSARFPRVVQPALNRLAAHTQESFSAVVLDGNEVVIVARSGNDWRSSPAGKTQVLALRIAHILQKTDVGADAVLCLTFTRSGVAAMRERLERYMGSDARKVNVTTFHSFAGDLIQEYYSLLDFETVPELLDETQAVLLVDELLHTHAWEYIRPRTNPAQYFGDLKQLISLLKRERMTPQTFLESVEAEVLALSQDPDSVSSRGDSKGKLKKEVEKKIASLERTKEVVEFYRLYEVIKKERALMDYDDVLEYAVMLAEASDEVRAELHQDLHRHRRSIAGYKH